MQKFNKIRLIVADVDGTLTDGGIYYTENGDELKKFSVKDGLGFNLAHNAGIQILVITGRKSRIVSRRMNELKAEYVEQGVENKTEFLKEFLTEKDISAEQVCYIGDDLNDLTAMKICGLSACPADAAKEIRSIADFVAVCSGGNGAFRECVEWLLDRE